MTGRIPDDVLLGSVVTIAGLVRLAGDHRAHGEVSFTPVAARSSGARRGGPCPLDERRAAACRDVTWRPIRRTMP